MVTNTKDNEESESKESNQEKESEKQTGNDQIFIYWE